VGGVAWQASTPRAEGGRAVGLAYLFVFGAGAAFIPFISIYYRSLGFGAGTIGWLVGVPLVVGVVAAPAWTAFADAGHRHRAVLATTLAGAATLAALIAATDRLALLLPLALAHAALVAPVISLIDNGALVLLGDRVRDYGRLRFWGTAGWGASALVVGWIVSASGPRWIFAVYVALMLCCLGCALRLPVGERPQAGPFRVRVAALGRDRRLWAFLGLTLTGGIGMSMVNAYLPLYLDGMDATGLVGVALLVATLSEMPVMLLGARILGRLGVARAFVLGYAVYGVRALAMSLVHAPWLVVGLQAAHGPSFALLWMAGVALAGRLAPAGLGATAQGAFTTASIGLGGALGAVLGGWIFSAAGPEETFQVAAVVLAVVVPALAFVSARRPASSIFTV
jgi:MFS transporter, PPP family, 3-phenylpropionic acid transporter